MKAIIYAGIGLFSVASVYGIVDYYNSKSNGTFDKIYKEDAPVIVTKKDISPVAVPTSTALSDTKKDEVIINAVSRTSKKKTKKTKEFVRDFKFSDFSRGRILPPKVIEEQKLIVPVKEETKE